MFKSHVRSTQRYIDDLTSLLIDKMTQNVKSGPIGPFLGAHLRELG